MGGGGVMDGTFYEIGDRKYRRVSSILNCANKEGLVPGAVKATALHIQALSDAGADIDWIDVKREYKRQWKAKADNGTVIHDTILKIARDEPLEFEDYTADQHKTLDQFENWRRAFAPRFLHRECVVYNTRLDYAGQFDFMALIGGVLVLGDYKTGSDIWPETALQLAAYANAEWLIDLDGNHVPMPTAQEWAIVHLRPDRQQMFRIDDSKVMREAWQAFQGLRAYARYPHGIGQKLERLGEWALPTATFLPREVDAA
jgi:hypothetical protein